MESTVIQDVQRHIKEDERQYNNIKTYIPLPNDPTKVNNNKFNKIIEIFDEKILIKSKVREKLVTQNLITPFFYKKPIIHITGISWGTLAISSVNYDTWKSSELKKLRNVWEAILITSADLGLKFKRVVCRAKDKNKIKAYKQKTISL